MKETSRSSRTPRETWTTSVREGKKRRHGVDIQRVEGHGYGNGYGENKKRGWRTRRGGKRVGRPRFSNPPLCDLALLVSAFKLRETIAFSYDQRTRSGARAGRVLLSLRAACFVRLDFSFMYYTCDERVSVYPHVYMCCILLPAFARLRTPPSHPIPPFLPFSLRDSSVCFILLLLLLVSSFFYPLSAVARNVPTRQRESSL